MTSWESSINLNVPGYDHFFCGADGNRYTAQRLNSTYVIHYFLFAKNTDSVPQTFAQGGCNRSTKETKSSTKHGYFVFVRAFHATKTKIVWKMWHSVDLFQFYTRKILYPRYFSPVGYIPKMVIKHKTSNSDVYVKLTWIRKWPL